MDSRFAALGCAAMLGVAPATAPSPLPHGMTSLAPSYQPCPASAAVKATSRPALTPSGSEASAADTIGGPGLATTGLTVPSEAPALPANLGTRAWLVADLDTGAVLGACAPHQRRPPASVQKLLLAATVLPRLDPDQVIEVTPADLDFESGSSAVGLVNGGRYSISTLWLGLLLVSGNDAANVLARLGGGAGSVAGTLQDMNALAYHLGARDTHAVTPHGLDGHDQASSVYDLALIARACFARDDFRRYASTRSAQIPAEPPRDPHGFQIQNDNSLLGNYPGAIGGKTGYTDFARHTYVGAAERDGHRLVVTMLGGEIGPLRLWQQASGLLDWGFASLGDQAVGRLVEPGELDPAPPAPPSPGSSGGALAARHSVPGTGGRLTWGLSELIDAIVAAVVITLGVFVYTLRKRHGFTGRRPFGRGLTRRGRGRPGRGTLDRASRDTSVSRDRPSEPQPAARVHVGRASPVPPSTARSPGQARGPSRRPRTSWRPRPRDDG